MAVDKRINAQGKTTSYRVRVKLRKPDPNTGKDRWIVKSFKSLAEARKEDNFLMLAIQEGREDELVAPAELAEAKALKNISTVQDLIDFYGREESPSKTNRPDKKRDPRNLKNELNRLENIKKLLPVVAPEKITPKVINECIISHRRAEGVSDTTIRKFTKQLKTIYDVMIHKYDFKLVNPINKRKLTELGADKFREKVSEIVQLENEYGDLSLIDEIDIICQNTESKQLPYIVKLAASEGFRRGDFPKMFVKNLDRINKTILIPERKNGRDEVIPLTDAGFNLFLEVERVLFNSQDRRTKEQYAEKDRFFTITAGAITHHLSNIIPRRVKKKYGFDLKLRTHDLKRTSITRMYEGGMSIATIGLKVGNKDVPNLYKAYVKPKKQGIGEASAEAAKAAFDDRMRLAQEALDRSKANK